MFEQADIRAHVVALEGEWDLSRGDELRRRLEPACERARVIVDLSGVTYIDSNCLSMLVRMRTKRVAKGYRPEILVIPSGNIKKIFTGTGFDHLWTIAGSMDEALGLLKYSGNSAVSAMT
ncbi:MAG TPA: STAS domain-containing protein [Candidatus Baltobacteraceae bacterium]